MSRSLTNRPAVSPAARPPDGHSGAQCLTGKRVAIVQPNYIPWKGYFDLIDSVDEFVLLDNVQYTRRDWRNRNTIKTRDGLSWLTIPVNTKGRYTQRINETSVADPNWVDSHWRSIERAYRFAPYFDSVGPHIRRLYDSVPSDLLHEINRHFLAGLCSCLGITTRLSTASEFAAEGDRTDRLVSLCRILSATEYVSGPAAQAYLDEASFRAEGIGVSWFEYSGYREYPQTTTPFVHNVSVLDVLFNTGPRAIDHVRRTERAS